MTIGSTFRNTRLLDLVPAKNISKAAHAIFVATALVALAPAAIANGFIEINQSIIENSGGFPYVIDAPGNYRLTSNIFKDAGDGTTAVIEIDASGVELDLNNFFMQGPGTCSRNFSTGDVTCSGHVAGTGIQIGSNVSDIKIKNGGVSGFFNGISSAAVNTRIERVSVTQNAFVGVSAIGDASWIVQVSAIRNGTTGIVVQNHSSVANCHAAQNDDFGVSANLNSSVTQSFVMGNRLGGMQLNPTAVFSQNQILNNLGLDPVSLGQDAGDNNCTNAGGQATGC